MYSAVPLFLGVSKINLKKIIIKTISDQKNPVLFLFTYVAIFIF